MPEVGRKCLESAHFRLTSGPAPLRPTIGPLRPTSVPSLVVYRSKGGVEWEFPDPRSKGGVLEGGIGFPGLSKVHTPGVHVRGGGCFKMTLILQYTY